MLHCYSNSTDILWCFYIHDKGPAIKKAEILNKILSSWI